MSSSIAGDFQPPTMESSRQSSQTPLIYTEAPTEAAVARTPDVLHGDPTPAITTSSSMPLVISHSLQPHTSESPRPSPTDGTSSQPTAPSTHQKNDASSDLSELSDTDEKKAKPRANRTVSQPLTGVHQDEQGEPIHYEAGTLVWARQGEPIFLHRVHNINSRCSWVPLVSCGCF
jgi:hypothetical protein